MKNRKFFLKTTWLMLGWVFVMCLNPCQAWSASRSVTVKVSCTILPVAQISSQPTARTTASNLELRTSQTLRKTAQGVIQYHDVTAL